MVRNRTIERKNRGGGHIGAEPITVLAAFSPDLRCFQLLLCNLQVDLVGTDEAVVAWPCNDNPAAKIKGLVCFLREDFGCDINQRDAICRSEFCEHKARTIVIHAAKDSGATRQKSQGLSRSEISRDWENAGVRVDFENVVFRDFHLEASDIRRESTRCTIEVRLIHAVIVYQAKISHAGIGESLPDLGTDSPESGRLSPIPA